MISSNYIAHINTILSFLNYKHDVQSPTNTHFLKKKYKSFYINICTDK